MINDPSPELFGTEAISPGGAQYRQLFDDTLVLLAAKIGRMIDKHSPYLHPARKLILIDKTIDRLIVRSGGKPAWLRRQAY